MAKVLIVHGISNQYVGEMELRGPWHLALCDGLIRANYTPLPEPADCVCPFYGDLFRPEGHMGGEAAADEEDIENANEDEACLLDEIWKSAAAINPEVPTPEDFTDTLLYAPRVAERALNALAKSKYLAGYVPLQFFGDLKQVVAYLNDGAIHRQILDRVLRHIAMDTTVVIGHSLGSVVAYEALCAAPAQVKAFVTLGSPLGIRNVVFDKLTPRPGGFGLGRWPGHVKHWTNVAARGDIVAAQKTLAPLFDADVEDRLIDSGWDAHSSTRYLNTSQAGSAIARGLSA
jgi:hypothetical protein